jgi:putative transposase
MPEASHSGRLSSREKVAVGINTNGRREVLGVATGPSEAETFWKGFLPALADRGLRGVKLAIADDHKGLRTAATKVFRATLQRCRVHWMRNALAHVPTKQRPAVTAMIKTIFAQETAQDAHAQWKSVADALSGRAPKLAELMDEARDDVLGYMAFPKSTGRRSPAPIRLNASTAKLNAAPMSSASFPISVPSFDWSVR